MPRTRSRSFFFSSSGSSFQGTRQQFCFLSLSVTGAYVQPFASLDCIQRSCSSSASRFQRFAGEVEGSFIAARRDHHVAGDGQFAGDIAHILPVLFLEVLRKLFISAEALILAIALRTALSALRERSRGRLRPVLRAFRRSAPPAAPGTGNPAHPRAGRAAISAGRLERSKAVLPVSWLIMMIDSIERTPCLYSRVFSRARKHARVDVEHSFPAFLEQVRAAAFQDSSAAGSPGG